MVLPIAISIRLNSDSQILRESEKLSLDPFRTEGIRLPCNFRPLSSSCPVPVPFFYLSLTDLGRGIKHLMGFFFRHADSEKNCNDWFSSNGETFYLERTPRRTIQFKPNGNLSAVYKSLSSLIVVDTTRLLIIIKMISPTFCAMAIIW